MKEILQYIKSSKDIPEEVLKKLTRVVIQCRIGNGFSSKNGVSPAGAPLYDHFLKLLDDQGIACSISALFQPEINIKIRNEICQTHLKAVLETLRPLTISERLRNSIDILLEDIPNAHLAGTKQEFKEVSAPFIQWSKTNIDKKIDSLELV